jgi:MtaA/CmuA family methyltransferase
MNGYERIMAAFRGEQPDTVPIMLHNFMMAAREAGITMQQFRQDPAAIARAFIQAVETYGYDGIIVDVNTVTLARAAGVPVDIPVDEPARTAGALLSSLEQVDDLEPVDISADDGVRAWLEAVTLLRAHFGNEILIRGNCDQCPFTLASMLRGNEVWLTELLDPDQRERVDMLLRHCTEITGQFIRLMATTGAHMTSNGDSFAGPELISPELYRTFALPYERHIATLAHTMNLPYILHICGNTAPIIRDMVSTGSDGLEIDYKTDVHLAHKVLKDRAVFVGNIDPSGILAMGTPALVEETTRSLLEVFANTPRFVLNAGCAIPPVTPPENLRAMIRAARQFSSRRS